MSTTDIASNKHSLPLSEALYTEKFAEKFSEKSGDAGRIVSLYENGIPPAIEAEMDCLYENFFSSPHRFKIYGEKTGIGAFVVREGRRITAIFAFRRTKNQIVVLNEQVALNAQDINHFSTYMFARFKEVTTIFFKATKTPLPQLAYPYHAANFTNDIVLTLPASADQYLAKLGKSTRENIKRYLKLLQRDFPSFAFEADENTERTEEKFHQIVNFNRARMTGKDKVSGLNEKEVERLWDLVKIFGVVTTISLDGQVRAGTICYRIGSHYFMRVIAHDSDYSAYRLGILCAYLTICECMQRGGKEFHFLWGREEYKFRLLGIQRDFDSLTIYRSRMIFLLNGAAILQSVVSVAVRKTKLWLLDAANQDKAIPRLALRTRNILRKVRK